MTFTKNDRFATAAALILAASLAAAPALRAQAITGPFTTFPSDALDDGRMLSLVNLTSGLSGNEATLGLSVPAGETSFGLRIFDGDTRKPCDSLTDPSCLTPSQGHWDQGTTEIVVRMYFDADRDGVVAPADPADTLIGEWRGNSINPTVDLVDGRWLADAEMPDNDWWELQVLVLPGDPVSPSGVRFYFIEMELDPLANDGATVSNFKVSSNVPLSIFSAAFGFEAAAGGGFNDVNILYPDFDIFTSPLDFFVDDPRTTYDGSFSFFLDVPKPIENFRVWDGDFDHGTGVTTGVPSGVTFDPCFDNDDLDSPPLPPFAGPNAVPQGALAAGSPADDNRLDFFRRSPCIHYTVTDPNGVIYRNINPSNNREWEQFLITSDPTATTPGDADYSPSVAADGTTFVTGDKLPAGLWTISVEGLDVGNSNFWRFELTACGLIDGAPACPPEPYLIGDRVWLDGNGNAIQDPGEPGVAGAKVNVMDDDLVIISEEATEATDGLYQQDVLPGTFSVELADENFVQVPDGALGDFVWLDANGDGGLDPGEPGMANVRILLVDPTTLAAHRATVTSAIGEYLFDGVEPGSYRTLVDVSTLPPGLSLSFGSNPSAVRTITSDETFLDLDFAYTPAPASLGDFVWFDMDGDGVQDEGEAGVKGVRLELIDVGTSTVVAKTKTSGSGFYLFTGLGAGTYKVEVAPSNFLAGERLEGFAVTSGPQSEGFDISLPRVLVGTEVKLDVDFGYDRADLLSITDRVFFDRNADGDFEPGEGDFPIEGVCSSLVTRALINGVGDLIATAVSDADGYISFRGLVGNGGKVYTIRLRDCSGDLDDLVGTSEPALDRKLDLLLTDTSPSGENFGFVNQARFDGWVITTPSTITNTVTDDNILTYDFGIRPPDCDDCDGKVTSLTLQYFGDEEAVIRVEGRKGELVFEGSVMPGRTFALAGFDKNGTLGPEIDIFVDGQLHTSIHTSCSQPIGPGLFFGDFLVTRGASRHGGELCPLEGPPGPGAECGECEGKVTRLDLLFLDGLAASVSIFDRRGNEIFAGTVVPGEVIELAPGGNEDTLTPEIDIYVDGQFHVSIHTSCSQPIGPGLIFGEFRVVRGASRIGGELCLL